MSYTDANCMSCGSCLQGCPTNAGKSTLNTYIHDAWAAGRLELRADARVERVVIEDGEAKGVEYVDADGALRRVDAGAVVVAAGTLNTPQLLMRSGLPDSPSSRLVGRNLGFHPVRLVFGLFDEPQDAHMVYPITAHAMAHQHDEDGGFVIEATTMMDPIGFATTSRTRTGRCGATRSSRRCGGYRHWIGMLAMVNDDNNGSVTVDDDGAESFAAAFTEVELARMTPRSTSPATCSWPRARRASGGRGSISTHVQGTCRMGSDPERSVVDADGQSWDVKRLYVGDGSLVPRTLSVNPSLTIMALADRLADHLHADPHGYLVVTEPIRDLAHLSHVELLTPKPDESLLYFPEILGMEVSGESGDSVYLRGFGDYERSSVKLTAAEQAGVGHLAYRTHSPEALDRRVDALEAAGVEGAWLDGDLGHGPAYGFLDPDGHRSSSSTSPSATRRRRSSGRR